MRVCTQRASLHNKYLDCTWTEFAEILNAGYWQTKILKNEDDITPKKYNDLTLRWKTTLPKNYNMTTYLKYMTFHSNRHLHTDYNQEISEGCLIENGIVHKVCGIVRAPSKDDIKYRALF